MTGTIESIHIAEEEDGPLRALPEATLQPGRGIVGDRYHSKASLEPQQEITLVEAEQIERFAQTTGVWLARHDTRRNVVTRGVSLNELVGREFMLGAARLRGVELCEPCASLARGLAAKTSDSTPSAAEIIAGLTHRAGLRACIVTGATVRPGDPIEGVS